MPQFCTCGAQLPEDALFCHKCGKPQREEPLLVEAVELPPPAPPPLAPQAPVISFHNGTAVRVALLTGTLAFLLAALAGPVLSLACLAGAGFGAVYFYRRRTGQRLSIASGARLGWITGIFAFLILMVLFTLTAVAVSDPNVAVAVKQQAKTYRLSEAQVNQMLEVMRTPSQVGAALLASFILFTALPALGGALGARMMAGPRINVDR